MDNTTNFLVTFIVNGAQSATTAIDNVVSSTKNIAPATIGAVSGMKNLSTSSSGLTSALANVGSRALVTIPIWMALRGAFIETVRVFDDSAKSIVDMDTALKHLEMQLVGTANAGQILAQVKVNSQALALQTGEAPATLIDVYNQLVTVGFSVQDAFKGMDTAAKGALVTNTDSADITNTLVNVYKELGSSITAVHDPAAKLNYIMDTMTVLMQKNHIGIKDFEAALKTFAGQAAVSNLTLDQTLSLIAGEANVSQTGQFAGRGLSGIFRQITNQRSSIEELLGKPTGGQSDWQTFQDVLTKIQSIKPSDTAGVEAITKIFSLRGGGQAIRALAEDAGHLTANLKLLYDLTPDERQAVFMGRLTIALAMIQHQLDITKQSIEALGRSFIEGVAGTSDFASVLANINSHLATMGNAAHVAGEDIKLLTEAMAAAIPITVGLLAVQGALAARTAGTAGLVGIRTAIAAGGIGVAGAAATGGILFLYNKIKDYIDKSGDIASNQKAMEAINAWEAGQSHIQHTASIGAGPADQTIPDILKASQDVGDEKDKQIAMEEQLKGLGYDRLETLQYELELLQQEHNYGEGITEQKNIQLEIAKQINNENKSRNLFDSDDTKLFKIAQKYGTDVAQDIGTVLQNKDRYNILNPGEQRIFAKQFESYDTSRQAYDFFRGEGSSIPINNLAIRNQSTDSITGLLHSINVTNHFNVKSSTPKETAQEVMKMITDSMKTPGSYAQRGMSYQQNGNNYDDSKVPGS